MAELHSRDARHSPTVGVSGDVYRLLATGDDTGGRVAAIDAIVPPGGGPPMHTHAREDEAFYVVEGEITFDGPRGRTVAGPGTFVYAPRGSTHRFHNATERPARMLFLLFPAGLEGLFREVGTPLAPGADRAPPPSADRIAALQEACPRYGVTLEPPG